MQIGKLRKVGVGPLFQSRFEASNLRCR